MIIILYYIQIINMYNKLFSNHIFRNFIKFGYRSAILAFFYQLHSSQFKSIFNFDRGSTIFLKKKQYIQKIHSQEQQYLLIILNKREDRPRLDKLLQSLHHILERLNLIQNIYVIENKDIEELHGVQKRLLGRERPRQMDESESFQLYCKSKIFKKLLRVYNLEPNSIQETLVNIRQIIKESTKEQIERIIDIAKNDFQNPILIKHVSSNVKLEEFKEVIHSLCETNLFSNIRTFIVKQPIKIKDQTIANDEIFLYRNDISTKIGDQSQNQIMLQKFSNLQENKSEQSNKITKMIEFLMPKIHLIRYSTFQKDISILIKKFHLNRSKYTICLRISPFQKNKNKIRLFHQIYKKYEKNFNFVIITTSAIEELFVHTFESQDEFSIFNYYDKINPMRSQQIVRFQPYKKNNIGSYQESFTYEENFNKLDQKIQSFFHNVLNLQSYNYLKFQKIQEINQNKLSKILNEATQPFILRFCKGECAKNHSLLDMSKKVYKIDINIANIGILENTDLIIDPLTKQIQKII